MAGCPEWRSREWVAGGCPPERVRQAMPNSCVPGIARPDFEGSLGVRRVSAEMSAGPLRFPKAVKHATGQGVRRGVRRIYN
jgi:hypothetical protein